MAREYTAPLTPPPEFPNATPLTVFPNAGGGFGFGSTELGYGVGRPTIGLGPTLPEGYDRTINMTVHEGRLTPSFAASLVQLLASPVPPTAAIPWTDATSPNSLPMVVILAGNDAYLFKDNALVLETDFSPRRAFTATTTTAGGAGAGVGIKYATTNTAELAVNDLVNITDCDTTHTSYNGLALTVTAVVANTSFTVNAQTHISTTTGNWQRESRYANAALHDTGTGTGNLYAGLKTGTRKLIQKRTRAGVWTQGTNTAIYVASSGGKFWATQNDYQIAFWTATTDPATGTSSATIRVGTDAAKINSIGPLGGSVLVGKEDGVWVYNEPDSRFEQTYPLVSNPGNCTVMEPDGAGGLYTNDANGNLIHIERFGTITSYSLTKTAAEGRDTPRGKITGITVFGDKVFVTMERGGKIIQPAGLVILTTQNDLTAFVDQSVAMTNQRFDEFLDLTSFDTIATNGDYVLIGADDRFALVDFVINGANRSLARIAFVPCNVSGGALSEVSTIVGSSLINGTDSSPATASTAYGQSGQLVVKHSNDLSGWTTPGALTLVPQYGAKFWAKIGLV